MLQEGSLSIVGPGRGRNGNATCWKPVNGARHLWLILIATQASRSQLHSMRQNARIEHDKALVRVMNGVMKDDTELFKQFSDDPMFRRRLAEVVLEQTYEQLERERAGAA
jgi:type I restriction enzyme, R subunit